MNYPKISGRLDNESGSYEPLNFRLLLERQRPALLEFELEEPIEIGTTAIFSMGFENILDPITPLKIIECGQLEPELFRGYAIDPLRYFLDSSFNFQATRMNLTDCLKQLCSEFNFKFVNKCQGLSQDQNNLIFLSTVRNALDQLALIYGLEKERWHLDFLTGEFFLLPGQFSGEAVELDLRFFKGETEDGLEFNIIPNLKPFHLLKWRDKDQVIDNIVFDSDLESMFIEFIEDGTD